MQTETHNFHESNETAAFMNGMEVALGEVHHTEEEEVPGIHGMFTPRFTRVWRFAFLEITAWTTEVVENKEWSVTVTRELI